MHEKGIKLITLQLEFDKEHLWWVLKIPTS